MKKETKNAIKENLATGASTAAGATAGVVIGAVLTPEEAAAQEVPTPDKPQPERPSQPMTEEPKHEETQKPDNHNQNGNGQNGGGNGQEPEVEVLGYDRITNEDGSQMDVAVVSVDGNEVGFIDVDLDGSADVIFCDVNQNGVIEEGEYEIIPDDSIAMQPLADAAGFTPLYAQNDMPDYVNDADVDTYMA
ncbi:MAG: hypothetical protein NC336_09035 [Clostridium sp.]|nr:hypothetical protein [Clostridium sp.]